MRLYRVVTNGEEFMIQSKPGWFKPWEECCSTDKATGLRRWVTYPTLEEAIVAKIEFEHKEQTKRANNWQVVG